MISTGKRITGAIEARIKAALLKRGIWISRTTAPSLVKEFVSTVRPKTTNRELVRFGGEHDGGYLIPDDLEGIAGCFSAGVGDVADFERDIANKGIRCFLADYSVDAPPVHHDLFDFEKKFVGTQDNAQCMTLESWMKRKAPDKVDLILQMDIEGAEYGVMLASSMETLARFRIMIFEFHKLDAICDRYGFESIALTFQKLLTQFEIVHIHPNNYQPPVEFAGCQIPPCLEITFLRKDRISSLRPTTMFPHPRDRVNVPRMADYALPRCWFE
jgi:hypothetical protein